MLFESPLKELAPPEYRDSIDEGFFKFSVIFGGLIQLLTDPIKELLKCNFGLTEAEAYQGQFRIVVLVPNALAELLSLHAFLPKWPCSSKRLRKMQ